MVFTVMACDVVAYIVMVFIVMAHVLITYTVIADVQEDEILVVRSPFKFHENYQVGWSRN